MTVYGSDEFPAFFTRRSGCPAPARVDTPPQAAALVAASRRLGLEGGLLLAVPVILGLSIMLLKKQES